MSDIKFNIAVLVDGDNAQAKLMREIIEEVSKYGKATIRRVYGDWTTPHLKGWKETINKHSINPIQKFSYTKGKNSTDGALIIDAMDILHSQNVDGFCIVSSDSDYTGLAKRIREEGLFVMGIGNENTPIAFVNSCEIFTFYENLDEVERRRDVDFAKQQKLKFLKEIQKDSQAVALSPNENNEQEKTKRIVDASLLRKAFDISCNEQDEAYISKIGSNLRKIDPSFDPRSYKFRSLTQLFESLGNYQVVKNEVNGLSHPIVKLK